MEDKKKNDTKLKLKKEERDALAVLDDSNRSLCASLGGSLVLLLVGLLCYDIR